MNSGKRDDRKGKRVRDLGEGGAEFVSKIYSGKGKMFGIWGKCKGFGERDMLKMKWGKKERDFRVGELGKKADEWGEMT
ncbi:hypothetical protein J1N35_011993 [Gossypium stocksii]|uniref:Uncharacterized protein n=1 Tax=Gossypium stocksii TaxID=47602 RepID=A0A9D4ADV8_9ROSI|nr:hypothetical protein J1N35_011993 [Gossypium stocksii]